MTMSPIIREKLRKSVHKAVSRTDILSICIHTEDRAIKLILNYCDENPGTAEKAFMMAMAGNRTMLESMVQTAAAKEMGNSCDDDLCLPCRRGRMMDRVIGGGNRPSDLAIAEAALGPDVMASVRWLMTTLQGTIKSQRSRDTHKKKAEFALYTVIPSLVADAGLVHDLQKALILAVGDRDRYHKLANTLMDKESDPASSK